MVLPRSSLLISPLFGVGVCAFFVCNPAGSVQSIQCLMLYSNCQVRQWRESVCGVVWCGVCVRACVRPCVRVCARARALRIVTRDMILRFKNTFIITII